MSVLLDANIFISYLLPSAISSPIHRILQGAIEGKYILLVPDALITEFSRKVSTKPYLRERIAQEELALFISLLRTVSERLSPITEEIPEAVRDPKDNYLVAYALIGQADYLVTGDNDLLSLQQIGTLTILRPSEFAALLTET
jgi:putative PIN family toxin of toxin-antitoxin system